MWRGEMHFWVLWIIKSQWSGMIPILSNRENRIFFYPEQQQRPKIDLTQTPLSAAIYPSSLTAATDWVSEWLDRTGLGCCYCSAIIIKDTHRVKASLSRWVVELQEWSRRRWMMCVISVCDNYDRMTGWGVSDWVKRNVFLRNILSPSADLSVRIRKR